MLVGSEPVARLEISSSLALLRLPCCGLRLNRLARYLGCGLVLSGGDMVRCLAGFGTW